MQIAPSLAAVSATQLSCEDLSGYTKNTRVTLFADFANCCLQNALQNSDYDGVIKFCLFPEGLRDAGETFGGRDNVFSTYVTNCPYLWYSAFAVIEEMLRHSIFQAEPNDVTIVIDGYDAAVCTNLMATNYIASEENFELFVQGLRQRGFNVVEAKCFPKKQQVSITA